MFTHRQKYYSCNKLHVCIIVYITGTAVGKLLTLGGVGIWWIVDVVLLVKGVLIPEDGTNWVPYY